MLKILLLTYGTLFGLGLIDHSRGALYPQILEGLQLGPAEGSWMFTAASIAAVMCAATSRVWLTKLGQLVSLRLFLIIQFIGCLLLGLIEKIFLGHSFIVLIVSALLIGGSFGGLGIILNLLVSKEVEAKYRKRALSGLHASYGAASFLAPISVLFIAKIGLSWSGLFFYASIFPLLLLVYSLFCRASEVRVTGEVKGDLSLKFILGIFAAFYVAAELSVSTRIVYFATEFKGNIYFEPKTYLAIFFFLLLTGRSLFFFFHFKGSNRFWLMLSLFSSLVFYITGLSIDPLYMAFCGFTMSIFFPCFMDYIMETVHYDILDGTVSFVMTTIGGLLIFMNWIIGALAGSFGITSALFIGPVFIVLSFVLGVYLFFMRGRATT